MNQTVPMRSTDPVRIRRQAVGELALQRRASESSPTAKFRNIKIKEQPQGLAFLLEALPLNQTAPMRSTEATEALYTNPG